MLGRNRLFVDETFLVPDLSAKRRRNIADNGQFPQVAIVCCADSRVPPEYLFGAGIGDLFLVRLAGNAVDRVGLGSLEFAVEALKVKLIIILGHSQCGAISETVRFAQKELAKPSTGIVRNNKADFPASQIAPSQHPLLPRDSTNQNSIWSIIESLLVPARETVTCLHSHESVSESTLVDETVAANVKYQADVIWSNSPLIRKSVEDKKLLIKCARSFIRTGQVFDVPHIPTFRDNALFAEPSPLLKHNK